MINLVSDFRTQYQFDGFGDPDSYLGIMLFKGVLLEVKEVVFEYRSGCFEKSIGLRDDLPVDDLTDLESSFRKKFPDVDHLRKYFQKHGSKEAKELAKQIATAAKKKS